MIIKKTVRLLMPLLMILITCYTQAQSCDSNYLSVSGNKLYDANGNVVRLTGINWFGFETSNKAPHGLWARDTKSMLIQIKDLGFNSVRIPWSNAILDDDAVFTGLSDAPVPDAYTGRNLNEVESQLTHPLDLLDLIIDYCQELDLKVILDNHSREPDGYLTEELWYTSSVSHEQWISDWVFLADRYKDLDTVVAMDINNEPHGKNGAGAQWGTGNIANDWRLAAEACGDAILAVNPNVLIMVEGNEEFQGETYWWGGNLKGVENYPVRLSDPSKLMYSPHEYGPTVFEQIWFIDASFPNNMAAIWEENFNYLITNNVSPLFAGEFGIREQGGTDEVWFDTYIEFMGENGYSWTFWCWNPNSGDTGGILTDDWSTIHDWKMNKLIPHLASEIPNGTGECGNTYTITASAATGGSISPSGVSDVVENSNKTYTISPDAGFAIDDVIVNGISVGAINTYTFTGVSRDYTISASFVAVTITQFTISASAGSGGTISPTGSVLVNDQEDQVFTISANSGFMIDNVVVDGASLGVLSTYAFSNVSANHSISVTFAIEDTGSSCFFGTPIDTPLPAGNYSYNNVHVIGTGGPDLSNVNVFTINWDLVNNGLWQMSMNTNNGSPSWWVDLRGSMTYDFSSNQPELTFSRSGFTGLDGSYDVNFDNGNFVMVSQTGAYAIYYSNSSTAPVCDGATSKRIAVEKDNEKFSESVTVYPNPFTNSTKIKLNNVSEIVEINIMNQTGQYVQSINTKDVSSEGTVEVISDLSSGIYILYVSGATWSEQIKILKQ